MPLVFGGEGEEQRARARRRGARTLCRLFSPQNTPSRRLTSRRLRPSAQKHRHNLDQRPWSHRTGREGRTSRRRPARSPAPPRRGRASERRPIRMMTTVIALGMGFRNSGGAWAWSRSRREQALAQRRAFLSSLDPQLARRGRRRGTRTTAAQQGPSAPKPTLLKETVQMLPLNPLQVSVHRQQDDEEEEEEERQ